MKSPTILLLLFAGLVALSGAVRAEPPERNVRPDINFPYRGADVDRWRSVFERPGREVWDRREDIVAALGIRPGMQVADIGAGTGFFSFLIARAVGAGGRVYAVDVTPEFVADIANRAQALGLRQVTPIQNDHRSVGLNVASIDLAFVCDTYHHFEYPRTTLRSLHRALRPGGELVVVDYRRIPGVSSPWVMQHVRAGAEQVRREVEAQGFELIEQRDMLRTQFFLRFRRLDAAR